MITKDNIKDLRPMVMSDLKLGGFFYFKDDQGIFRTCQINEIETRESKEVLKAMTEKWISEKRLFVRKDQPMQSFTV